MTVVEQDYYETLGVGRDADQKAIKDAFRRLALKYHPDRNKEPGAEERFKAIAEAYAVLSDPKKRTDYDRSGFAGVAGFSPEDLFGGINFQDIFGAEGFDLGFAGGSLFDRFFGRHRAGPVRGDDIEVSLVIPLDRVVSGGDEQLHIHHPSACPVCKGSGAKVGTAARECPECRGSGRKTTSSRTGRSKAEVLVQQITVCPSCHGSGRIIDEPCPRCAGRGEVSVEETLTVNIPVGVEEGMALRVPGHGLPSRVPGGAPGDLLVVVRSAADSRFSREGADLWHSATLSPAEAALGAEFEIPTLDGSVIVTVPPGTQPGSALRLSGKGLPEFGGRGRGDLYLRLHLQIPERLSEEARQLYQRLRALDPGDRIR
ncbi:MAG TPA: DnaJ C-terminal domain-containing protein [Rhodocyclaceae bacterium]|nr:DnaJ C-terminal domain-containing protein [Rhodocyclaceae bacterium]